MCKHYCILRSEEDGLKGLRDVEIYWTNQVTKDRAKTKSVQKLRRLVMIYFLISDIYIRYQM